MAKSAGTPTWKINNKKPELTSEVIEAKAKEITGRFSDLFIAFGLVVTQLAEDGDPLGLFLPFEQ